MSISQSPLPWVRPTADVEVSNFWQNRATSLEGGVSSPPTPVGCDIFLASLSTNGVLQLCFDSQASNAAFGAQQGTWDLAHVQNVDEVRKAVLRKEPLIQLDELLQILWFTFLRVTDVALLLLLESLLAKNR